MAEFDISERRSPALVYAFAEAPAPAASTPDPVEPSQVAPAITRQPAITGGSTVGGSVTLDPGAATGTPDPSLTWDVTLGGVSVRSQAVASGGVYTLALSAAGLLRLSASWANVAGTVAATAATRTISAAAPPAVAMTAAPTATPAAATVGDTVTLGVGSYQNAASVVGVLMQGGVNRTAQIVDGVWLPSVAGAWTWTVTATGAGGDTVVNTVSGTVAAAPVQPSVNYALADGRYGPETVIAGTAAAVTGTTNGGNGGWNLAPGGTGAEVTHGASGFGFTAGKRLTASGVVKSGIDGVFIAVRATLAAYGGSGSYILSANPSGALISIYDNNGALQARYHDGTTRTIALGATPYGTEFTVGLEINNQTGRVRVRDLAGEIVESTPVAVPGVLFTAVNLGQVVNGTIHEAAIFVKPTGGAFPSTFEAVIADFLAA